MAKIKKIKLRENGVYGEAINLGADAVNIDLLDGTNVEESLLNVVYHEDSTEVENIELGYEHQENKTQIVDSNSTEAQYPSAKAVYDAILANKELGLVIEVVDELPGDTDVINELAIYLTPNGEDQGENIYNEYVRINGKWEFIGTTKVDLSNYYNKEETDERYAKAEIYGDTAISLGRKAETKVGASSVAEGYEVTASGTYSHAEGHSTIASGPSTHAEGHGTKAEDLGGHAEGLYSVATGVGAHAEGGNTETLAWSPIEDKLFTGEANATVYQVAYTNGVANSTILQWIYARKGKKITINPEQPFSEAATILDNDYTNDADGNMIVTVTLDKTLSNNALNNQMAYLGEDAMTQAIGDYSHAEGQGTVAYGNAQHTEGKFNQIDYSNTYAHIVGNGTASERSNAHTIKWDGTAWFNGDVYVKSTGNKEQDEGSQKLATEEYVNAKATVIKTISTGATQEEQTAIMNELYQAYLSGCDVKLIYEGYVYDHVLTINNKNFHFYCGHREAELINGSFSQWQARRIVGRIENNSITYVYIEGANIRTISPSIQYSNPYMPEYDGSPATKKYVDDTVAENKVSLDGYATEDFVLENKDVLYIAYPSGASSDELRTWGTEVIQHLDNEERVVITNNGLDYELSWLSSTLAEFTTNARITDLEFMGMNGINYGLISIYIREAERTASSVGAFTHSSRILTLNTDYETPYMPEYDGSPATKKYVDDSITAAITAAIEEAY